MTIGSRPKRRSARLAGFDYGRAGGYFVTICSHLRQCLFGEIVDGAFRPNELGDVVAACWSEVAGHFPLVETDAFVVMPNHVHGIVILADSPLGGWTGGSSDLQKAIYRKLYEEMTPASVSGGWRRVGR